MREERGQIAGDWTCDEACDLRGIVAGTVTVVAGGKLYVRGAILGDLNLADGGRVHIYGNVQGTVRVAEGAKLIHSGVVGQDLINEGGRVFIDASGRVMGRIRTLAGQTRTHKDP